jgi:hypothetical protein
MKRALTHELEYSLTFTYDYGLTCPLLGLAFKLWRKVDETLTVGTEKDKTIK